MKYMRLVIPVIVLCLMITAPLNAFASGQTRAITSTISMESDTKRVTTGDKVTVKIVVREVADLYGIQFLIKYDPSKLSLEDVKPLGDYKDFRGQKVDHINGTILLPVLREGASSTSSEALLNIAELRFTAKAAGNASLEIQQLKAISSDTYQNTAGYKDLREFAITTSGVLNIVIQNSSTIDPNPSPGTSPNPSPGTVTTPGSEAKQKLQSVAKALNEQKPQQALDELTTLLSKGVSALSVAEREELKSLSQQLLQQLQESVQTTIDSAVNANKLDDESLIMAIQAISKLTGLATTHNLQLPADKEVHLQLAKGKAGAQSLLVTLSQAKLLEQYNVSLVLNYDATNLQKHKLGVYLWNESTTSWDYIRSAKQYKDGFKLSTNKPGIYAVMEFPTNFADIDMIYKEAQHAIEALSAKYLMLGTGDNKFSPNKEITRAEFVALVTRILNLDPLSQYTDSFKDVDLKAWYAAEVNAAKKAGIIQGDGSNFNPNEKLTREAMAVMLVNAGLLNTKAQATDKFADDASISDWAKDAIYQARENGLIKGVGSNILSPKSSATRADVAVILLRLIEQQ